MYSAEDVSSPVRRALRKLLVFSTVVTASNNHWKLWERRTFETENNFHFWLDGTKLHIHGYPSVKLNLDSPDNFMMKYGFKMVNIHILCIELRVVCTLTGHMLGWGQRIATRTGVESSSDWSVSVIKGKGSIQQVHNLYGPLIRYHFIAVPLAICSIYHDFKYVLFKERSTMYNRSTRKDWLLLFCRMIYFTICFNINISLMYTTSWDKGLFMKNFRFETICNITQEPSHMTGRNLIVPVGSSVSLW